MMSESGKDPKSKKKSPAPLIGFAVVIAAIALMAFIYTNEQKRMSETQQNTAETVVSEESAPPADDATQEAVAADENAETSATPAEEPIKSDEEAGDVQVEEQTNAEQSEVAPAAEDDEMLKKLATPRVLGDPNSPIEIREHSSFSCGHCKRFHETNFKEIKKDYIDTGKAHIVFDDFPRNIVDLSAGVVARCVPDAAYFNYIQLLFETQDDWAFKGEHLEYLKQNAKLIGLTDEQIDACLNNQKLQDALAQSAQTANQKHGVSSTPTLVINGKTVIPGLAPYEDLKKALDAELEKSATE